MGAVRKQAGTRGYAQQHKQTLLGAGKPTMHSTNASAQLGAPISSVALQPAAAL
jgi:hypothetical protein